ncbi:MAG TPA: type III-A CRISPR-associated RAMP protein Csm4 [Candidatus Brocadiia bacterium]|nr:hypothetical protein [Candidatus Brocadiales bacterium]
MKIYEITIKPITGFGTPLKGDTIFGHFCWQIAYDEKLIGKSLDDLLSNYHTKPFVIFSSAYPKLRGSYALKTPDMPADDVFELPDDKRERIEKRKENKAKRWMMLSKDKRFSSFKELEFLRDKELIEWAKTNISEDVKRQMRKSEAKDYIAYLSQSHNSINRLTGRTGEEGFAPFAVEQHVFFPETELALFVGIDGSVINIEHVRTGLERIGTTGFGKDASTGLGRFKLGEAKEIDLSKMGSDSPNACYTLSPCVPESDTFAEMFFSPFTRFGRHGDVLAKSPNPFKNPVIMADEGGVFIPKTPDVFNKHYIGRAVTNISKAEPKTVMQGYSLYILVRVEV